ncbi:site-specific DNA-methyltransferase [Shinella sp.]|uniref:site-specific DNA-methyltransferase n=1 Tax=Shinella sp. TaxID=1870904 RepID=UPI003F724B6B
MRHQPPERSLPVGAERVVMLATGSLRPYPRNARKHSRKQVRQIADSISRFGFTNPVLVDDRDMILAGHGRVEAARLLQLQEVPCIRLSTLSEAEKRAYILADNKLAQNASWDEDILASELALILSDPEAIEVSVTGFSVAEVDLLLETGETGPTVARDEDDAVPTPTAITVTRPGDIWQLGDHRLICGDARDESTYRQLLVGAHGRPEHAQMVFTDPPYNVRIQGNVSGSKAIGHREFVMASGEMSPSEFRDFLKAALDRMAAWSSDGSIHFVCMDWRHMDDLSAVGQAVYSELKNVVVWVKDNGGMGSFYRSRHEFIFVFKNGTAPHLNSFGLGQNGRYRTNVWNYRGISSSTRSAREEVRLHPTVKPAAMVADAMKDCSSRGGIVLDPFCGSGTILIAAEKTGRHARAIELDPVYCDVAIRRWQHFAKGDAILVETGETFEARMRDVLRSGSSHE